MNLTNDELLVIATCVNLTEAGDEKDEAIWATVRLKVDEEIRKRELNAPFIIEMTEGENDEDAAEGLAP